MQSSNKENFIAVRNYSFIIDFYILPQTYFLKAALHELLFGLGGAFSRERRRVIFLELIHNGHFIIIGNI